MSENNGEGFKSANLSPADKYNEYDLRDNDGIYDRPVNRLINLPQAPEQKTNTEPPLASDDFEKEHNNYSYQDLVEAAKKRFLESHKSNNEAQDKKE